MKESQRPIIIVVGILQLQLKKEQARNLVRSTHALLGICFSHGNLKNPNPNPVTDPGRRGQLGGSDFV
ncbi:hypothetical protein AAFF_G00033980 [Aldrovandia affinis]|uniref:Uncharacterized protein n=1 Tax=Aldrovandia affinis TaxID=143900 RepID=A0AAD7WG01_9TELE|nr:hypothetical protein AAFF_G00033980 [Aldrovandia affinis]